MGIEPTSEAWEASILPLYDARSTPKLSKEPISRKLAFRHLLVAEATHQVVVHQTGGLHERVDNCRTDKPKAALLQIFAQGRRQRRHGWQLLVLFPFVLNGRTAHELPHVFVEAPNLLLHLKERLSVRHRCGNFQTVADNFRIGEEFARFLDIKSCYFFRIKPRVNFLVAGSLLQNRVPTQARLRAFQNQKFKPLMIVVDRHTRSEEHTSELQ